MVSFLRKLEGNYKFELTHGCGLSSTSQMNANTLNALTLFSRYNEILKLKQVFFVFVHLDSTLYACTDILPIVYTAYNNFILLLKNVIITSSW